MFLSSPNSSQISPTSLPTQLYVFSLSLSKNKIKTKHTKTKIKINNQKTN